MADQIKFGDLLDGSNRLFTAVQAKRKDGTIDTIQSNGNGALMMELTNGNVGLNGISPVNGKMPVVVSGATLTAGDISLEDVQSKVANVTLQNAATAAGNGTVFTVGAFKTITLSINGTSTSRTIVFEVADSDGNYTPIQGVKLNDFAMGTQTTGTGEKWTFEVTGVTSFRTRVTAVAGGNVTVKGTAVA